jgi:hypothetical protein
MRNSYARATSATTPTQPTVSVRFRDGAADADRDGPATPVAAAGRDPGRDFRGHSSIAQYRFSDQRAEFCDGRNMTQATFTGVRCDASYMRRVTYDTA